MQLVRSNSIFFVIAVAIFAQAVSSQKNSSVPLGTETENEIPEGNVMTHVIQVGDAAGSKLFYPQKITAKKGDLVQFHFYPKQHSVAQGSFEKPCQPLENANGSSTQGFWSGFMPVSAESKTMPVFSILVNDTNPIWFYCATMMHCQSGLLSHKGCLVAPMEPRMA
ncbi:extracellular serine-rich protein [Geopyxis carbonaria]|nr:extracellular serine-rich protein [Geopyxis carbonaria]